jgi:hypothetical protein
MNTPHVISATGAALLMFGIAAAAQNSRPPKAEAQETQVTVSGCLQREADYRRANDSGRGGVLATGAGLKNEFVLVNTAGSDVDCTNALTGEAYELTGNRERELEPFVGRSVQITGLRKKADTIAGTPTGGVDPLGQDLKLFEINVGSFSEVTAAAQAQALPQPRQPVEAEPEPVGTAGAQAALPQTASPLPITGLIGLFSLVSGLSLRSFSRRRQ